MPVEMFSTSLPTKNDLQNSFSLHFDKVQIDLLYRHCTPFPRPTSIFIQPYQYIIKEESYES